MQSNVCRALAILAALAAGLTLSWAQEDAPDPAPEGEQVIAIKTITNVLGSARKPAERTMYVYKTMVRIDQGNRWITFDTEKDFAIWVDPARQLAMPFSLAEVAEYRQRYQAPISTQRLTAEPVLERTTESRLISSFPCTKFVIRQGVNTEMVAWVAEDVDLGVDWNSWELVNEDRMMATLRRRLRNEVKGLPMLIEMRTQVRDIPVRITQRTSVTTADPGAVQFMPDENWLPADMRLPADDAPGAPPLPMPDPLPLSGSFDRP